MNKNNIKNKKVVGVVNGRSVYLNKVKTAMNQIKWHLKSKSNINTSNLKDNEIIRIFADQNNLTINGNTKEWVFHLYNNNENEIVKRNTSAFYNSKEWTTLRTNVLKMYGPICMKCGCIDNIVVDHILPRSKFKHLELELSNMQVLCNVCNIIKSNKDYTDYRTTSKK